MGLGYVCDRGFVEFLLPHVFAHTELILVRFVAVNGANSVQKLQHNSVSSVCDGMSNGRGGRGRGGPGRGHSGRGPKTENNNKDLQSGGAKASLSKSGIPILTHNSLPDDVTQFFEALLVYTTEQYENPLYRMCYTAERFDPTDGPPPTYPELTDTIQGLVPNPEFVDDLPEGPENPREIPGPVRKYEVRNGRLTSEGERKLNSDTRFFERELEKWTKDSERLDREKCKFHSIIVTHLSSSAKR